MGGGQGGGVAERTTAAAAVGSSTRDRAACVVFTKICHPSCGTLNTKKIILKLYQQFVITWEKKEFVFTGKERFCVYFKGCPLSGLRFPTLVRSHEHTYRSVGSGPGVFPIVFVQTVSRVSALEMWRGRWQIWRSINGCLLTAPSTKGTPIPSARVFFRIPAGDSGNPLIKVARCLVVRTCSISNSPAFRCVICSFVLALHQQHRPHNILGLSV